MIGSGASFNLGQFIFDRVMQHAQSHGILKPIAYPSILCSIMESQKGIYVADIPLQADDTSGASGSGNEETTRILGDEIRHLDRVIQTSIASKSVLEARLRSLTGEVDPGIDGSGA
ncbi:hypothetical protein LIER_14306 [Lithospermum erythrorhizon]|uniref:Uncharacterized protein n=1 Tax=Lithospermum erythrorhizon TaxID=34254 RepID=A0AAV3PYU1_LITER